MVVVASRIGNCERRVVVPSLAGDEVTECIHGDFRVGASKSPTVRSGASRRCAVAFRRV
ncbi:hypothetical protein ACFFQF_03230 [Haladaptatus pallidirubidus]